MATFRGETQTQKSITHTRLNTTAAAGDEVWQCVCVRVCNSDIIPVSSCCLCSNSCNVCVQQERVRMKTSVCRSQKVIAQRANNLLWRSVFRRSRPSWLDCKTHHFNPLFICSIQQGFVSTTSNSLWTLKRKRFQRVRACLVLCACVLSLLWVSSESLPV